ncbi:MAG TPA: APC family permease [Gemmatimonadaceae bacterium]|nr:APC family permease [Gemmatimonadaceae bacterium]
MKDEGLVRALGVRGLTAGIVNYTVGSGIFVLPAIVAARLGGASMLAYVVCAIAMCLIVMCFAEAGSRVSLSGGVYAYAGAVFGPYVGFVVATTMWFGATVLSSATVATIFITSLGRLIPAASQPSVRAAILVLLYASLAALNIRGVKLGSRLVVTATVAKLAPLFLLVIVGLLAIQPANLTWTGFPSVGDLGRTSTMLIFAFLGVETALTPSGEVKDPARTVPRSIFIALVLVTILYLSLQVVAQGVLGSALATNPDAPLAAAARVVLGRGGEILILVGAAISTFGYVAGDMLAAPRLIYALGRDRLLPPQLALIHSRFRTPWVSIVVHALACCVFAIIGSFGTLAVLASLATLLVYLACCLATLELRRRNIRTDGAVPFKVPGGPVIPVLASAIVVWLISTATRSEFIAMGWMLVASTALFAIMSRIQRAVVPAA